MADEVRHELQSMTKAQHRVLVAAIERAGREIKIPDTELTNPSAPARPIGVRYWGGDLIISFRLPGEEDPATVGVANSVLEIVAEIQSQLEAMTPVQRHVLDVALDAAGGEVRTDFGSLVRSLQWESLPIRIYHYDGRFIIRTRNPLMVDGPDTRAPYNRN